MRQGVSIEGHMASCRRSETRERDAYEIWVRDWVNCSGLELSRRAVQLGTYTLSRGMS